MKIFPAIDIYNGGVVRLYKGDYGNMTEYGSTPVSFAYDFYNKGAKYVHLVDLEGARYGTLSNLGVVREIAQNTPLFCEVGGGIRSMEAVDAYFSAGVGRIIIGTAAVENEEFLIKALKKYPQKGKIAVGVDLLDGYVAIRGWTVKSKYSAEAFFRRMEQLGVGLIICTDISKDGAMQGTNRQLYKSLSEKFSIDITASGGVSSIDDVKALAELNIYGAIIGKAYYNGAIDLTEAVEVAK